MKTKLLISAVVLMLTIAQKQAAAQTNPGDNLFDSPVIHDINIILTQPNWWDSLMYYKQFADSFNLSTQSMMGNVIINGTLVDSVGIKLKGNSSFGYPGQKKPIKIKLNEYVPDKKFDGLKTLNLNNNMLDPTMMREKLALDFLNKKGLAAPRCAYARVSYNGQYVGLYKLVEQIDKTFLKSHFGNNGGNLFKGDPAGSLIWLGTNPASYYPYYELHTNEVANDWTDLVNLIDNINNTPAPVFYDTLETILNTNSFIRQWAARNLFADLDAYFHAPHNYYLYHSTATNKFEWNTWDVSVSFGFYPYWFGDSTEKVSVLHSTLPLTQQMLGNTAYKTAYLNAICEFLDYFDTSVMSPVIDSIANKIYPHFAAEPDSNQMFPEQALFWTCDTLHVNTPIGRIPALKKFIASRRNHVLNELASLPFVCTNSVNEFSNQEADVKIYPNPFSAQAVLRTNIPLHNATLTLVNIFGQAVKQINHISGQECIISRDNLAGGLYFIRLTEGNKQIAAKKIIISDGHK